MGFFYCTTVHIQQWPGMRNYSKGRKIHAKQQQQVTVTEGQVFWCSHVDYTVNEPVVCFYTVLVKLPTPPYNCMLYVFLLWGKKIKNTQIMLTCLSLSQINNLDYFRLHGQEPALINKHEARLKMLLTPFPTCLFCNAVVIFGSTSEASL